MSKTYDYVYAGGKLLRQTLAVTIGDSTTTYSLDFFYDASGVPFAVTYNDEMLYYITDLQGDVMSIVDAQGEVVASYSYDPYGNIVSQSGFLAEVNPLRYRGYVYDTETTLYYLQSRYYDPEMGRFINGDALVSTGQGILGNNMFAYCLNNPPIYFDALGREAVRIDLTDADKDGDGIPDEPATGEGGSSGSGYTPPSGGGGVSNSYWIFDILVDFGHGGRHIDATQYDISQIEYAIANDVVTRPPSYSQATSVYGFRCDGLSLYYSYFTRGPAHINVGTYYIQDFFG